jgi:hypothetical protein
VTVVWLGVGMAIYFGYGRHNSITSREAAPEAIPEPAPVPAE